MTGSDYDYIGRTSIKVAACFIFLLMVQCSVNSSARKGRIIKELPAYKTVADHIISRNYHEGFSSTLIYDLKNLPNNDSLLQDFMRKKGINNIQCIGRSSTSGLSGEQLRELIERNPVYPDSLIEFHFFYTPIFGKRRELVFDFSTPEKTGTRKIDEKDILAKGIYYRKY